MDVNPPIVNKWDGNAVKNALDDGIKSAMMDKFEGGVECFSMIDRRLVLSFVAVCCSLAALLYDYLHPFPESRHVLVVCVVSYFIVTSILTYYTAYVERGTFVTVNVPDAAEAWSAASELKKYETTYKLSIQCKNTTTKSEREAKANLPIEKFFDADGKLQYEALQKEVIKLASSIKSKME